MNTNLTQATQTSTPASLGGIDPAVRHNCAGFTYTDSPESPFPDFFGETWTDAGGGTISTATNVDCATTLRIICVQQ